MALLLSSYLNVDPKVLEEKDILDAVIGVDIRLFLDPHLLKTTTIPEFKDSYSTLEKYFSNVITLLSASTQAKDRAWREAKKRLIFKEVPGISIGYGSHSSDGNAIGPKLGQLLIESATEIFTMGIKDPEIFTLLGLFEEGFGADRLSDMTIAIVKNDIYKFSQRIVDEIGIKNVIEFRLNSEVYHLPKHPRKNKPLLFLPKELLRDLPVALTWEGIDYVVSVNQELRNRLNQLIGHTWRNKITKKQLKELIFSDKNNIENLVSTYKASQAKSYNFEKDPAGEVVWYELGKQYADQNPTEISVKSASTMDQLESIVKEIIIQFKKNIEVNGLKEHLYIKEGFRTITRPERFSQLLFYSTADTYCSKNNLVLSREPNAGNGPVDFKISNGYRAQILVELKLSKNRLLKGYQKQLPAYERSENSQKSFYVVLRTTRSDTQIQSLLTYRENLIKEGKTAPEIIVIDARLTRSASRL